MGQAAYEGGVTATVVRVPIGTGEHVEERAVRAVKGGRSRLHAHCLVGSSRQESGMTDTQKDHRHCHRIFRDRELARYLERAKDPHECMRFLEACRRVKQVGQFNVFSHILRLPGSCRATGEPKGHSGLSSGNSPGDWPALRDPRTDTGASVDSGRTVGVAVERSERGISATIGNRAGVF